jgi:hypothetical protein
MPAIIVCSGVTAALLVSGMLNFAAGIIAVSTTNTSQEEAISA